VLDAITKELEVRFLHAKVDNLPLLRNMGNDGRYSSELVVVHITKQAIVVELDQQWQQMQTQKPFFD
jgi:hypothetical protein